MVVSNNNSAVENVAEKLSADDVGLGFLVAQLGNKENKERFVANQTALPDMSGWELPDERAVVEEIKERLHIVSQGFEKQTRLAKLRIEKEALRTESRYNELQRDEISPDADWLRRKPSHHLLALKCHYEAFVEREKNPGLLFYLKYMWRFGFKSWSLLHQSADKMLRNVESAYYSARMN